LIPTITSHDYIHERDRARNAFSVKYRSSVEPNANKWEYCSQVLSRRDVNERLALPWK